MGVGHLAMADEAVERSRIRIGGRYVVRPEGVARQPADAREEGDPQCLGLAYFRGAD